MRLRTLCAAAVAAAFSVPVVALAQTQALGDSGNASGASQVQANPSGDSSAAGSSMDSATFNRIDQDKDGFITREEAAGTDLANRFDQLDTDHDGKLSPSEVKAGSASSGSSSAGASPGGAGASVAPSDEGSNPNPKY